MSGFFAPQQAFAAAGVTPASDGTNISIDTTSAGGTSTFSNLNGPAIAETVAGDIVAGTHTVTLPSGWEFDISSNITISKFGGNIVLGSTSVTPTQTSFSFVVTNQSTSGSILGFSNLKVRPTGTVSGTTGNMTYSGAGIIGVDGSTNFGTLSTVPGTVAKLVFATQPGGAEYGSLLNPQPVVKTQDQFGNDSTKNLVSSLEVGLTLTNGTGALIGDATLDIGTGAGNGTVTFTDLTVNAVGAKQLTAGATGLTIAVSNSFDITPKTLIATITALNKVYDGNNSATFTNPTPVGAAFSDVLTLSGGSATFADANVGTNKTVTATELILAGDNAGNYAYDGKATGAADIIPLGITVTPTIGQTKVYGNADPIFTYTFIPALIGTDTFTGALGRVPGKNVGTYAYTLGTLSAGSNYTLTLGGTETFVITVRTLNVTATGVNKVYDATTDATVTLLDDRVLGDNLLIGYTAAFAEKNIGTNKPVSVTVISISGGTDMGNYVLGNTTTDTTANITAKQLTVSFTTYANKTYDGDTSADITDRSLTGVIDLEDVNVTGGSATFADKHIGIGKTVTATGFTLTGADKDNYAVGTINTTTGNVNPRPITVTAVTDTKIYNGTTDSDGTPVITSTFSPPVALVDEANFIQTYENKNVGTLKTLTPSGSVDDGNVGANYTVTFVNDATGVITEKTINVTAQPDTKTYDGTTSSDENPVVDPLETGDTVGTSPTQAYNTKDVGTLKTLTPSGLVINDGFGGANYLVNPVNNTTGVISPKGLTVSGAVSIPKIYDGNTTATVNFVPATLVGIIPGEELLVSLNSDDYSTTYDNKNVGTGKTVTVSGLSLAGAGAGNYALTQPVLNDGVIAPATLTITATGVNKVYDANTTATVTLSDDRVPGDDLTLGYTANFTDKNVGIGKTVNISGISITGGADAGNYILGNITAETTADITPAPLTATITAADKVYDGNTSATITGRTLDGVIGSDIVVANEDGLATFDTKNVGPHVVSANSITITGADALNYSYNGTAVGNADITPLGITGSFTADDKVYDGNTTAAILTQSLESVLLGDEGNVILTGGTANFADPNVTNDITVTASGMILSGSAAGNYELISIGTTEADITQAPLTITAENKSKVYGDANPTLTASYVGFVGGENESVLDTPVELSTTADATSPVGDYPITASEAVDVNYNISFVLGTLTVTPAPLTVTADAQSKIYGEDDSAFTYEITSGALINEDVLAGSLSRDAGENVDAYAITSTLAHPNYNITFVSANLTINKKPITVMAVTNTKIFDGNTSAVGTPTFADGSLVGTDTANFTEIYDTENAGTSKTLTPSGVVNDGNGGTNYSYTFEVDTTGVITTKSITITPGAGQSKVYGQLDSTFAYTNIPALIDGDVFIGALSRVEGENVGTYEYELGSLTAGGNYSLALETETFEIVKATPVITWENPADIVYGDALSETELNATADVDGAFVYTPVSGIVLNAGDEQELSVTFTPTDTANYSVVEQTVVINVNPASLTVTADDKSKDYGESDPALTYSYDGLVNGDTEAVFSGSLVRDSGEDVGEYDINQGTVSAGTNYAIAYESGTLTIEDTVAPTIVSHTPSLNALNISPTTAIAVTFSEAVVVESGDVSFSPTISGGFTIINSGTSVVTITPNNPLADNTTYTITLDGVADINGNPLATYSNIKFTTATIYSINLNANASGWNLISLPVVPSNTAIATVLGGAVDNIDAVWTYDPTNPNAVNGWLVFVPGNPEGTNNLTLMTTGFGYWVSVTGNANLSGSGTLLIAGSTSLPSRNLVESWNLVGYYQLPNEDDSTHVNAFASIGAPGVGYKGLWGFDNTTGFFKEVTTILPGDGFWILLPSAKAYAPSNIFEE